MIIKLFAFFVLFYLIKIYTAHDISERNILFDHLQRIRLSYNHKRIVRNSNEFCFFVILPYCGYFVSILHCLNKLNKFHEKTVAIKLALFREIYRFFVDVKVTISSNSSLFDHCLTWNPHYNRLPFWLTALFSSLFVTSIVLLFSFNKHTIFDISTWFDWKNFKNKMINI